MVISISPFGHSSSLSNSCPVCVLIHCITVYNNRSLETTDFPSVVMNSSINKGTTPLWCQMMKEVRESYICNLQKNPTGHSK